MTHDPEFESLLRQADASFNVAVIGQILVPYLHEHPTVTLLDVEEGLRRLGANTHVVAVPQEKMAPNTPPGVRALHPATGQPARYWVWFCLHGEAEAVATMRSFGTLSVEENRERLRDTGFLMMGEPYEGSA
jgi:hypothetical protein